MSKVTTLDELRQSQSPSAFRAPATFDPAAWHAMQERDATLIRDQLLHGVTDDKWVYSFDVKGKKVEGVSVIGARHLASQYGGIKSRIVASVDKAGSLFIFKSFEPLQIVAQRIFELEDVDDFYEVVMEIQDIKTGNSIQVRKKEEKTERRRDGSRFERPHYDVIAESKAFRNGVLALLPQDVVRAFMLRAKQSSKVAEEKTIDQLRAGVLAFAARSAIPLDRPSVESLTYEQIWGLGSAARGTKMEFRAAAEALGLMPSATDATDAEPAHDTPAPPPERSKPGMNELVDEDES
jgi:hypothetical protein